MNRFSSGRHGEHLAEGFLKANGYRILRRNVKSRFGEIDLVAQDGKTLCFVEVKSCALKGRFNRPEQAVGGQKQRRLIRLALWYLKITHQESIPVRFDVVSILTGSDGSAAVTRLIKGAFEGSPLL